MAINHQIVTDAEGRPVAAQIPWDEFIEIQDRLDQDLISAQWREEIATRAREIDNGKVQLVDGHDFLQRLRGV
jgi:Putative addiction module component